MTYQPQQPQQQWQQQPQAPQQQVPQDGWQQWVQPQAPRPNAFANTPIGDWVRDGVGALLLLVSLAMPWSLDYFHDSDTGFITAAGRVEILLVTLLSTFSIAIGYLARVGAFGASFTAYRAAITRGLVNLPYVLLIALYVVFDAIRFEDLAGGLGPAAVVGLFGALLVALPRRYEVLDASFTHSAARSGYGMVLGYSGFAGVLSLLGIALTLIAVFDNSFDRNAAALVFYVITGVMPIIAIIVLLAFVIRRSEPARLISLSIGTAALVGTILATMSDVGGFETVWGSFGYTMMLLAGLGGVMQHPGLPYAMRMQASLESWVSTLRAAPMALIIGLGYLLVISIYRVVLFNELNIGLLIGVLVCVVLSAVAAVLLRMQLMSNFQLGRVISASIAAGIALIGLVAVILAGVSANDYEQAGAGSMGEIAAVFFGPSFLVLYALFVPKPVREYFASVRPQQPQYAGQQYGGQQQDATQMPASQSPQAPQQSQTQAGVDPRLLQAANDPNTSQQDLANLSAHAELWPIIARHPNLYEELANWLAQTGDPQVLEVLRSRGMQV